MLLHLLRAISFVFATCLARSAYADEKIVASDPWFSEDKALHFAVSMGLASVGYAAFVPIRESRVERALFGAGVGFAAGVLKESIDLAGYGDPSWKDLTWDVIGVSSGVLLALGLDVLLEGPSERQKTQMRLVPSRGFFLQF